MKSFGFSLAAVGLAICTLAAPAAQAQLSTLVVGSGFSAPVQAASPLAGGPLFVVELGGAIKAVQGGSTSTFLNVPVASGGEQGLLGIAFDPGYANPASPGYRRFFVNYIEAGSQDTVVASYRATANPLLADPASRVEVLRIDQPNGLTNHKAGWIGFKPGDANNLYIATGDGGGSNDPSNNAQNLNSLLGKMLRVDINRDDFASPTVNYGIPTNNPFVSTAGARGEIFAYGLRNPFRNGFDSATGNLWIGDVGQSAREEVDFISAASAGGQNFGWRVREGDIATPSVGGALQPGMVDPVLAYNRTVGTTITGGFVVHNANLVGLDGQYIFADYGSDRIWSITADGSPQSMASATEWTSVLNAGGVGNITNIVAFAEGAGGELYIVEIGGRVVQVVPEPGSALLLLGGGAALLALRRRRQLAAAPATNPAG